MKNNPLPLLLAILTLSGASQLQAGTSNLPIFNFTTIAGDVGTNGWSDGSDGVTGTNAWFSQPEGIVVDGAGNLYIADRGNSDIRKIDPAGVVRTFAGQGDVYGTNDGPALTAAFEQPAQLAIDTNGNLFVTDQQCVVRKIDTNGIVTTIAGQYNVYGSTDGVGTNALFNDPEGITIDDSGNLFVVDSQNCTIRKIDTNGVVSTFAGKVGVTGSADGIGTNATFHFPEGMTRDAEGNLYVVDSLNNTIRKIDTNGVVSTYAGNPQLAGSNDGIRNLSLASNYPSSSLASFNSPWEITSDANGNLYVSDGGNETIRRIGTNGLVTTVGGTPKAKGHADGLGAKARFFNPSGVALDDQGNIYVADMNNDTIRKGTLGKLVQTIKFPAIVPKPFGSQFKIYSLATASSGLPITITSANTNVASVNLNTNDPSGHGDYLVSTGAGTTTLTASQSGDDVYLPAQSLQQKIVVSKTSQTVMFTGLVTRGTYSQGEIWGVSAVSTSGTPVVFKSSNTNVASISGTNIAVQSAGVTTITATASETANYKAASTSLVVTILKGNSAQTFEGAPSMPMIPDFVVGATYDLSGVATFSANFPVNYVSSNPKFISISGTTMTVRATTGSATIYATFPGNKDYLPMKVNIGGYGEGQ